VKNYIPANNQENYLFMKNFGFTLIDLMVSIAIFGLISASVLINFLAGARGDSVRQSANIAANFLRRAQTMTLSGELLANGTFPSGGYGIRFDSSDTNTLILFGDNNGDHAYDAGEEINTQDLVSNAYFNATGNLDVLFSSPDADVYFNGATTDPSKQVVFSASETEIIQNVIIYRVSGQIRVE